MRTRQPRRRPRNKIDEIMFRKPSVSSQHFTIKCLIIIFTTVVVFILMQWVSFLVTRQEQAVMVEWFWKVVGFECGAMMLRAIVKIIVARAEKKEKLKVHISDEPSYETEE